MTRMDFAFVSSSFSGDISGWDTSSVVSMGYIFEQATFSGDVSAWDTSSVTDLGYAFHNSTFASDVSLWDTSRVVNMEAAFTNITQWTSSLAGWDVSSVGSFSEMFSYSDIGEAVGDLSGWSFEGAFIADIGFELDMTAMFLRAKTLPSGFQMWDTSRVLSMAGMFLEAEGFEDTRDGFSFDISGWNVESVTNAGFM